MCRPMASCHLVLLLLQGQEQQVSSELWGGLMIVLLAPTPS